MILMRGSILDENVKKGVGGLYLFYFTLFYLLPTRSEEEKKKQARSRNLAYQRILF